MFWIFASRRKRADKLMQAGEVAKAIPLYRKDKAWEALTDAYLQQGDTSRAADAARTGGLFSQSADLFEKAGQFRDAAGMWLRAGDKERAAAASERAGDMETAVRLYRDIGKPSIAADVLAGQGKHEEAGELYEEAGEFDKAAIVYKEGGLSSEAARALERVGRAEEAAHLYYEGGYKLAAAQLMDKAGLFKESAACYAEIGEYAKAGENYDRAGYVVEAADAYEQDPASLGKAAEVYRRILIAEPAWRRELRAGIVAVSMSDLGQHVGICYETSLYQLCGAGGEPLWQMKPPGGARPLCVAVSHDGMSVLGCDDKRLHLVGSDRNILWSKELGQEPRHVAVDSAGDRIVCCTRGNRVLCMDDSGGTMWEQAVNATVCGLSFSPNGKWVALGTTDNRVLFYNVSGEPARTFPTPDWADALALGEDGAKCALALGMRGVALLDVPGMKLVWTAQEDAPVLSVALTPDSSTLSVTDSAVILRRPTGEVIARYRGEGRVMGGCIDNARRHVLLWNASRTLTCVELAPREEKAAELYEKASMHEQAGAVYESLGNHTRAAAAFKAAGDLHSAARNIEVAGSPIEAADLYESVGDFDKAAPIFEAQGELARAADCFSKTEQWVRAARLYEQAGDFANAAQYYERAGQFDKAGTLYKKAGNAAAAIDALADHVRSHPDAAALWLELGELLQSDGQHDKAIECFQKSAKDEESRRPSQIRLAECFVAKELYDIAISRYRACLAEGETPSWGNLDVFYGLGKALQLAGNYGEAKRIYEGVLAIDFQHEDVKKRLEDVKSLAGVFGSGTSHGSEPAFGGTQAMFTRTVAGDLYQQLSSDTRERYIVKGELGKGGMGQVFLAEDTRLKRQVALKVLAPHLAADMNLRTRMVLEAQAAAQIDHPNCVRVFDVGDEGGQCYLTMEYVTGKTVRKLLEEKERLEPKECAELMLQACAGLAHAHKKGITHRDIKPENIIITDDGTAKVMDFGLALAPGSARLTAPGGISGTLPYMAPEQLRGDSDLTPAVDVYAMGCMIFELLTGKMPFEGENMGSRKMSGKATPISTLCENLPEGMEDLVNRCLAVEADARYPDGKALRAALLEVKKKLD